MLIRSGCGPPLPAVIRGHPALVSSKSLNGETRQPLKNIYIYVYITFKQIVPLELRKRWR